MAEKFILTVFLNHGQMKKITPQMTAHATPIGANRR